MYNGLDLVNYMVKHLILMQLDVNLFIPHAQRYE